MPWYVGVLAVMVGFSAWIPSWLWMKGRYAEALPFGTLVPAAHMIFLLAFVAPHVTAEFTARDLAAHFNRRGSIPDEVVIVEDRVGSVIFYLDATLRAKLRPEQIHGERAYDIVDRDEARVGSLYAVAENRVKFANGFLDLEKTPWESAGRFRLYEGATLHSGSASLAQSESLPVR